MPDVVTVNSDTAQPYYDGIRASQQRQTPISDFPELGQGGYHYIGQQTGSHLTIYDGSLCLSIALIKASARLDDPARSTFVLVAAARHAAEELRDQ